MLNLISFVGVDEKTNIDRLIEISTNVDKKPYNIRTEWGFLISHDGVKYPNRYMSYKRIHDNVNILYDNGVRTSVHICGRTAIDMFLLEHADFIDLCKHSRVQINLNMKNFDDIDFLSEKLIEISQTLTHNIVIQSNNSKKELVNAIMTKTKNHEANFIDFLYDASGGLNKEISDVKPVYENHYTGYAGGISPNNVKGILKNIDRVNSYSNRYYIDMESGVRDTKDFLSLDKCESVVTEVFDYIDNNIFY